MGASRPQSVFVLSSLIRETICGARVILFLEVPCPSFCLALQSTGKISLVAWLPFRKPGGSCLKGTPKGNHPRFRFRDLKLQHFSPAAGGPRVKAEIGLSSETQIQCIRDTCTYCIIFGCTFWGVYTRFARVPKGLFRGRREFFFALWHKRITA